MSHDIAEQTGGALPDPNPTWESLAVSPDGPAASGPADPAPSAVPAGAHPMPSGNWVVIADARTLTRGDKRELIREASKYDTPAEQGLAVTDLLHRRLITAWSYPHPLPSADPASLELLPAQDDDALDELIKDANRLLFPRPVSPDDYADPASPTAPSGA